MHLAKLPNRFSQWKTVKPERLSVKAIAMCAVAFFNNLCVIRGMLKNSQLFFLYPTMKMMECGSFCVDSQDIEQMTQKKQVLQGLQSIF